MFSESELTRYSRHLLLPEIGKQGQAKLKNARVLVVGAGGLGCPALMYLAAAGVGKLGVIDYDKVEASNLHRQLLYRLEDVGKFKAEIAALRLSELNPEIEIVPLIAKLDRENVKGIFQEFDIIVDGSDNFAVRYLINDACFLTKKPLVSASVSKFEGQISVFHCNVESPTYRCLYPTPPSADEATDCSQTGVLGIVPGIMGLYQANEVFKLICGIGEVLSGKLLVIDLLEMQFHLLAFERNEESVGQIPASWEKLEKTDYEFFCGSKSSIEITNVIGIEELRLLLTNNEEIQFLDVREEYEIPKPNELISINIPLRLLSTKYHELNPDIKTIVYCQSGLRSQTAVHFLLKNTEIQNIFSLEGGINTWTTMG